MVKPLCSFSEKCYRKREEHFVQYDHPHLNMLLDTSGISVPVGYSLKTSPQTLLLQLEIVSKLRGPYNSSQPGTSKEHSSQDAPIKPSDSSLPKQEPVSPKKPISNNEKLLATRESLEFIAKNTKRIHITIEEKWKASCPYHVLYTSLDHNQDMPNDKLSIIFSELLDKSFGTLESSLLLNFMVEFGWLLACYITMGYRNTPMTLIYGECDEELDARFNSFLTSDKVKPSLYGSHHTKMMIFSYTDNTIRVVVCTANLVESDWRNRTQGVWISPHCEKLPDDAPDSAGESETYFKSDLLRYLSAYRLDSLKPWIDKVKRSDMSYIKVVFVASVPGTHSPGEGWGQAGLRKALRRHVPAVNDGDFVIVQCSSIGSLGPEPSSYFAGEILETLKTNNVSGLSKQVNLHLIYPAFRDVEASADGLLGGGCLPYSSQVHAKQEWLHNYLRRWKSNNIGRTRAVPHIKSYTRVSSDLNRAAYFLLTSANLSKAAWGKFSKSGSLNILSYEAGVLFLPRFVIGSDYLPLTEEEGEAAFGEKKPKFTLPYDLPLTNYSESDIPWFIDNFNV